MDTTRYRQLDSFYNNDLHYDGHMVMGLVKGQKAGKRLGYDHVIRMQACTDKTRTRQG